MPQPPDPTVQALEVADGRYGWLRRAIFVGTLASAKGGAVQLQFFHVT